MTSISKSDSGRTYLAYRLISELRDLGADSVAWRNHLVKNLEGVVDSHLTVSVELERRAVDRVAHIACHDYWNEKRLARASCTPEYQRFKARPTAHDLLRCFTEKLARHRFVTADWKELILGVDSQDAEPMLQMHRSMGVDRFVYSGCKLKSYRDRYLVLMLHRQKGDESFSVSDIRLVKGIVRHLGEIMGTALASTDDPSPSNLPKRRRDVLEGILLGKSDEEIGAILGMAYSTVRSHVKEIYQFFKVGSRAELMALWIDYGRSGQKFTIENTDRAGH